MSESGGLYDKQPSGSEGNIYNVNDAEEQVLGYFYSSQVQENWIVFKNRGDIPVRPLTYDCDTVFTWPDRSDYYYFPNYLISIDTIYDEPVPPFFSGPKCLDCRAWGGILEPPEYWNEYDW